MGFHTLRWADRMKSHGPAWSLPDGGIELYLAQHERVQSSLTNHARRIASRAEGLLEVRHDHTNSTHRAFIHWQQPDGVAKGPNKTDHRIHLAVDVSISPYDNEDKYEYRARSETVAILAAKSIEYGHQGRGGTGAPKNGGPFQTRGKKYAGKWILHDASGLAKKGG